MCLEGQTFMRRRIELLLGLFYFQTDLAFVGIQCEGDSFL